MRFLPEVMKPRAFFVFVFGMGIYFSILPRALSANPTPDDNATSPFYYNRSVDAVARQDATPAPKIDGLLDDPAWKTAARLDKFIDPQTSKPTGDQTEVYLLYDKEYIYVGYHCYDSQPSGIVGRETVRDAQLKSDDFVSFELDPFLTYKFDDFTIFMVNPRGTRSTHISGGRAGKVEWQGDWDASAKIVSDGWTAEMRIPWGMLSYPRAVLKQNFGMNFRRMQQRTQVRSMWSNIGVQFFNEREGLWKGVVAPANAWKPRLSFLPYLMPSTHSSGGRSQIRVGLDARYQPTPELTAVGTINPDFSTVEGAVEGIFFSRSQRYVPDKRPFFLEGSDYFELGRPYQLGLLFNPANIGQFDVGAKLYGKVNPQTTLGFLSTVDIGNQTNIVANVRRELGKTANMNVLLMQRVEEGADNSILGMSQNYRRGKWGFDTQYFQSLGKNAGGAAWTGALNLEDKNFFSTLRYRHVNANFNDSLGFIPFNNYQGFSGFMFWGAEWRKGFWRGFEVSFFPTWDWDLNGIPFRRSGGLMVQVETRSDNQIGIFTEGGKFYDSTDFTYGVSFVRGATNRFKRWGLNFVTGQQANLPYTSIDPSFSFRLGKRSDIIYTASMQSYQGFNQQHIVTFNYEINPFQSWGGRIVLESTVNFYLSYRNAGRKGTDFYFVIGDPNAQAFVPRFLAKWVFAF